MHGFDALMHCSNTVPFTNKRIVVTALNNLPQQTRANWYQAWHIYKGKYPQITVTAFHHQLNPREHLAKQS